MTNTRDIIVKLKEVREEKGLSYGDILELMEKNGDYLAKSTLSRVFADGSEEQSFKYEETIRPIANALLDIETIEDDDDMDVRAMKTLLKYKSDRISELERQLEQQKCNHDEALIDLHEKMDIERASWGRSIDFLKDQVKRKDERIDILFRAVAEKDAAYTKLLNRYLTCPYSKLSKEDDE